MDLFWSLIFDLRKRDISLETSPRALEGEEKRQSPCRVLMNGASHSSRVFVSKGKRKEEWKRERKKEETIFFVTAKSNETPDTSLI